MAAHTDQGSLQSAIEEKSLQITTQGGAVRELKDRVKAKKKAKVYSRIAVHCLLLAENFIYDSKAYEISCGVCNRL